MFNSKTTFIIGAGASKEANLPIGSELTAEIGKLLDFRVDYGDDIKRGDPPIYFSIKRLVQNGGWEDNKFLSSGREMAEAMSLAPSIDTFLETHQENYEFVTLGKMGIVRAISLAEKRSLLAPSGEVKKPFRMIDLSTTWYTSLAQQLFSGISRDNPDRAFEGIRFIVFNYDRCLEVFLLRALKVYFRVSDAEAAKIVGSLNIIHPYGALGSINPTDPDYLPFGQEDFDLLKTYERIRTFSESLDGNAVEQVRDAVADAETIVFLGFGFGDQNMDLIAPSDPDPNFEIEGRQVFGTSLGLSPSDAKVVADNLSHKLTGQFPWSERWMHLHPSSCSDLFSYYWRSLTSIRPKG